MLEALYNRPLIQLIPSDDYSIGEKYLQQSRLYRNLASFQEWPLVPFILSSRVKSSFSLILYGCAIVDKIPNDNK